MKFGVEIWGGCLYSLVMTNNLLLKMVILDGKNHYFDWAIFHSYVKLPEGKSWENICLSIVIFLLFLANELS